MKIAKGFTLIEILISLTIIIVLISVTLPISYNYYLNLKESLQIYKLAFKVSEVRRNSFLFSNISKITIRDNILYVNELLLDDSYKFYIDSEIFFYKNGTSNGGNILIDTGKNKYMIKVSAPIGEISVEKK